MFCEKCGTQLPDTASSCTNCGASTKGEIKREENKTEKIPDTEIQLKVKPTFKFGYMVLPSLIVYIIVAIVMALMIAPISVVTGITVGLVIFLICAVILAIKTLFNKKQFDSFTYDFYKTKVIYRDSFLNVSEKEVKYKYIREVTMRQTFIQRFFNIGSIILFTNAETGFGNGIFINCVEDVQNVYKNIKSIIDV